MGGIARKWRSTVRNLRWRGSLAGITTTAGGMRTSNAGTRIGIGTITTTITSKLKRLGHSLGAAWLRLFIFDAEALGVWITYLNVRRRARTTSSGAKASL